MKKYSIKNLFLLTSFVVMFFSFLFSGFTFLIKQKSYAFNDYEDVAVTIGELWLDGDNLNGTAKKFNGDNVNLLLQCISGKADSSIINFGEVEKLSQATKEGSAIKGTTAKQMRDKDVKLLNEDGSFNSYIKDIDQDIVVTLGGLKWTVTYLSSFTTTKENGETRVNPVLTLWLSDSAQLRGKSYISKVSNDGYTTKYTTSTFAENGTSSVYWADIQSVTASGTEEEANNPFNMYATSSIRSITLNNGDKCFWKVNQNSSGIMEIEKQTNSVFSVFTCEKEGEFNDLTDYIISPSQISWQETQSYKTQFAGVQHNSDRSNEGWGANQTGEFYSDEYNYTGKPNYSNWKDDKLWLPSATEVGSKTNLGIWELSGNQLVNVGNTWLRSAYHNKFDMVHTVEADGTSAYHFIHDTYCSVRPALHLNLADVIEHSDFKKPIDLCEVKEVPSQQWNPFKNTLPTLGEGEYILKDNQFITQPVLNTDFTVTPPTITAPNLTDSETDVYYYTITATENGRYKGEKLVPIKILKRNIEVALKGNEEKLILSPERYTTKPITPKFTGSKALVDFGYQPPDLDSKADSVGVTLKESGEGVARADYTLSYSSNTERGTATITITGTGYYEGEVTTTFEIIQALLSDGTMSLNKTEVEFNYNKNLISSITETIIANSTTLVRGENADYELFFYNNETYEEGGTNDYLDSITLLGTYRVVAVGRGNYTGTLYKTFTVTPATLQEGFLSLNKNSVIYNGLKWEPEYKESFEGLEESTFAYKVTYTDSENNVFIFKLNSDEALTDFIVSFGENINAGTGTISVTGKNRFRGTISVSFTINPKSISGEEITASYNLSETFINKITQITPSIVVSDSLINDDILNLDTDYTISYGENINVGTGTITITGKGNYDNSTSKVFTFTIVAKSITAEGITFPTIADKIFSGQPIMPEEDIVITDGEITLQKDVDYTITYGENTNVGTKAGVVTITGKGNYSEDAEKILYFNIVQIDLDNETVTVTLSIDESPTDAVTFTSLAFTPEVSVTFNETGDELDANYYTVTYWQNGKEVEMINVGIYTVKVEGKLNYGGEATTTFTIEARSLDDTSYKDFTKSFSYTKNIRKPDIELEYFVSIEPEVIYTLKEGKDFNAYYYSSLPSDLDSVPQGAISPIECGTYYIVLKGINNFTGFSSEETFRINKINLTNDNTTLITFKEEKSFYENAVFSNTSYKAELQSVKILVDGEEVELWNITPKKVSINWFRDSEEAGKVVATTDFTNWGKITVVITSNDGKNIDGSTTFVYTIRQRDLTTISSDLLEIKGLEDKVYSRQPQDVSLTIKDKGANNYSLKPREDFSFKIDGDYTEVRSNILVEISAVSTGNYSGKINRYFNIIKATITSFVLNDANGQNISLKQNKDVYTARPHTIREVVKTDKFTLNSEEYELKVTRSGSSVVTSDFTNVGVLTFTISIKESAKKSFQFSTDSSFVNPLTYEITPLAIKSVKLSFTEDTYDTQPHTISIDEVRSVPITAEPKGMVLVNETGRTEYTISYTNKETGLPDGNGTYSKVCTIIVTVHGTGNFTGEASSEYSIIRRQISVSEIKYYITGTSTLLPTETTYKGFSITPVIAMTSPSYTLKKDTDYTFAIYKKNTETNSFDTTKNLYGTNDYLEVGEYVLTVAGIGNFITEKDLTTSYKVNPAPFVLKDSEGTGLTITIPQNKFSYTSNPITLDVNDIQANYTKQGSFSMPLVLGTHYEVMSTGYVQVFYKTEEGKTGQAERINILTKQQYESGLQNNENVFIVQDGYLVKNGKKANVTAGDVIFVLKGMGPSFTETAVPINYEITKLHFTNTTVLISGLDSSYVYEARPLEPTTLSVKYKDSNVELPLKVIDDFDREFIDNINAGSNVKLKITGKGSFDGVVTFENVFAISTRSLQDSYFTIQPSQVEYSGEAVIPTITGTYGGILTEGTDYDIEFVKGDKTETDISKVDFIEVGIITINFTGKGNFSGSATKTFNIKEKSIVTAIITLSSSSFDYNGKNQVPDITVTLGGSVLDEENYKVEFFTESGAPITDKTTIKEVGTYRIKVSGANNYSGEIALVEFKIVEHNINSTDLTHNAPAFPEYHYTYNGQVRIPTELTIKHGDLTLVEGKDFYREYYKSAPTGTPIEGEPTNAGTYYVVLVGQGNYTGTKNFAYSIVKMEILESNITLKNGQYITSSPEFDFSEKKLGIEKVEVTVDGETFNLYDEKGTYLQVNYYREASYYPDGVIAPMTDFKSAGNIRMVVTATDSNNISIDYEKTYTITKRDIYGRYTSGLVTITGLEKRVYNAKKQEFDIEIFDSEISYKLVENKDYTITYETDCINAKENIKVTFNIIENSNYKKDASEVIEQTFTIEQATVNSFVLTPNSGVYNREAHTISYRATTANNLTLVPTTEEVEGEYSVVYSGVDSDTADFVNVGSIKVKIVLPSNSNFKLLEEFEPIYRITPATITSVTLETDEVIYNTLPYTINITSVTSMNEDSEEVLTLTNSDSVTEYSVTYNGGSNSTFTNAGTVTVVVNGGGNFTGTIEKTFTIKKWTIKTIVFKDTTLTEKTIRYDATAHPQEFDVIDSENNKMSLDKIGVAYNIKYSKKNASTTDVTKADFENVGELKISIEIINDNYALETSEVFATFTIDEWIISKILFDENSKQTISTTYNGERQAKTFKVFDSDDVEMDKLGVAYNIKYIRQSGETTNFDTADFTNAGEIKFSVEIISDNYALETEEVYAVYTINKMIIKELLFAETSTNTNEAIFNGESHLQTYIVKDSSGNVLNLEGSAYNIVASPNDFVNVGIKEITIELEDENNYEVQLTNAVTFTIKPHPINSENVTVSYFEANEQGEKLETPLNMSAVYEGSYLTANITATFNIQDKSNPESYTEKTYTLTEGTDYILEIYTEEDYLSGMQNNLYKTENFASLLNVNNYRLIVKGIGNYYSETYVVTNYSVSPADFNFSTINIKIPQETNYTSLPHEVEFDNPNNADVLVTYTKPSTTTLKTLEFNNHFKLFNGYMEVTFAEQTSEEVTKKIRRVIDAKIISLEDYLAKKEDNRDNVFKVDNGYVLNGELNNTTTGLAVVVLQGISPNFKDSTIVTSQFYINRVGLSVEIKNQAKEYTYTGYPIEPIRDYNLEITSGGIALVEGVDYTISYQNNTNVGSASYIIEALGSFTGRIEYPNAFTITPKEITGEDVEFTISEDTTYNGTVQKPLITGTLKVEGKNNIRLGEADSLSAPIVTGERRDYFVRYLRNNVDVPNFTDAGVITIQIYGINNFTGHFERTYRINQWVIKEIVFASTQTNEITTTYNGEDQQPSYIVRDSLNNEMILDGSGKTLLGTAFEIVSTSNNFINAATITISVVVKDNTNFSLAKSRVYATFIIKKASLADIEDENIILDEQIYTGFSIEPAFTLNWNNHAVSKVEYNIINYSNNLNVGSAQITIEARNINFEGRKVISFEIKPKALEENMVVKRNINSLTYTGSEVLIDFDVTYGGIPLVRETDYTYEYENNINANSDNSASLIITGQGNYSESVTIKFSIKKATPVVIVSLPTDEVFFRGDSFLNEEFVLLNEGSTAGTITNSTITSLSTINTLTWRFVPEDSNNYEEETGSINLKAYYYTVVSFGDVSNVLAGNRTFVPVYVNYKLNSSETADLNPVSVDYFEAIVTRDNIVVGDYTERCYKESGKYTINVTMRNDEYYIVGDSSITFQVKSTIIYSNNNLFYAEKADGFDADVVLDVSVFTSFDSIISEIKQENYNALENIIKVYKIRLLRVNSETQKQEEIEDIEGIKIYHKADTSNAFYYLHNDGIEPTQAVDGLIEMFIGQYLIECSVPFNFMLLIIFGGAGLLILIIIILIIVIAKRKKKKGEDEEANDLMQNYGFDGIPNDPNAVIANVQNTNGFPPNMVYPNGIAPNMNNQNAGAMPNAMPQGMQQIPNGVGQMPRPNNMPNAQPIGQGGQQIMPNGMQRPPMPQGQMPRPNGAIPQGQNIPPRQGMISPNGMPQGQVMPPRPNGQFPNGPMGQGVPQNMPRPLMPQGQMPLRPQGQMPQGMKQVPNGTGQMSRPNNMPNAQPNGFNGQQVMPNGMQRPSMPQGQMPRPNGTIPQGQNINPQGTPQNPQGNPNKP